MRVSFDGGRSWSGMGALPLPAGTVSADDVTVAFTPDGRGLGARARIQLVNPNSH
ncbi:hypothetical protein GCM10009838_64480 [Catenulispora subtropica]|uniref:Exo-alpha-sialidase n=1 Tax=Catenulispora subtropica TaxID=450798 RepID=A0ABP5E6E0_9ACTN